MVKRGGNVGLFPFPRVGRSDPELMANWEPATAALLNSLDDYNGSGLSVNEFKECHSYIPFLPYHL